MGLSHGSFWWNTVIFRIILRAILWFFSFIFFPTTYFVCLFSRQQLPLPECFAITSTCGHKTTWQCDRTERAWRQKMLMSCITNCIGFWSMEAVENWTVCPVISVLNCFPKWVLTAGTKCQQCISITEIEVEDRSGKILCNTIHYNAKKYKIPVVLHGRLHVEILYMLFFSLSLYSSYYCTIVTIAIIITIIA